MSFLAYLLKPLAYISLPVMVLHTLSQSSPLVRYYVRLGIYLSALGVCSVWGVIISIAFALVGRRFDTNWMVARTFLLLAGKPLDIKFQVEGEEHLSKGPAILIGNHQSMLDVLYLGRILPKRSSIMAKKELQWMPLLGQFMTLSGAVFVDRGNNAKAVRSLAAASQTMKARRISLWVFPEGTRTNKPEVDLRPFKKGAFHLAVQGGVPITPVVVENYYRLYHKGVLDSGTLKIRILPPIPTTGLVAADVPELAGRIREQMLAVLHELSGTQPSISEDPIPSSTNDPSQETVISTPTDESAARIARRNGSDKGAETEEDEGMVLVDRPVS
ncbi:1-acylglycerol-3-phosphate O [Rickenella mellea]|uniref:1-acyl-sn-glycerol-3-phosphate acyltransferase n=1 Tax=Rickenella mellea TaxID=50990 RepID=A0A4R5XGP8_9AGAM|nr:1-acylglycerol-3-phosphate O [Rickenella mellea]